jgi:hypothetical protein
MPVEHIPRREIAFAARFGFLRKSLWNEFFAVGNERWRRRQWLHMLRRKYFLRHPSGMARDVIVLNQKNNIVRKMVGEHISSAPFVAQIDHDEIVARALLRLESEGCLVKYRIESELKRQSGGHRQHQEISDKEKYPDAIVDLGKDTDQIGLALEIELTRKNPKRYRQILSTYAGKKDIQSVVFIARSDLIFQSLKVAMRETQYPDWERPIGFCHLDEWIKDPSKAVIHFSERVTTLREMANRKEAS